MLHLFKRVYLALDETLDTAQHRVVLSQDYGHPMGGEFASVGQLLTYASSIDDIVGSDKTFQRYLDFFTALSQDHDRLNAPVIVYADRDSFVKIGTNFFRAELPLATAKDIYQILSYYTVRQHLLSNNFNFQSPVQNYEKLKAKSRITEAEGSAQFFSPGTSAVDFYDFFASHRNDLSLEFLIATYSFNGQCQNIVSEQVKGFCIKHAYASAVEARQFVVDTLGRAKTRQLLNLADRPLIEMIDILKQAESTALLFDDRLFPRDTSAVSLDANWRRLSEAEIAKISKIVFKIFKEIILWALPPTEQSSLISYGFFDGIKYINNPAEWAKQLDLILNELPLIANMTETNKVNGMLLNHIVDSRKQNRDLLRPFVINGCI